MKPKIYYDRETDTLSIWNGIPASEAEDVAEHLVVDFNDAGETDSLHIEKHDPEPKHNGMEANRAAYSSHDERGAQKKENLSSAL